MEGVLSINTATREILSDVDFSFISQLVYEKTGIVLGQSKREMVTRRLLRRRRALDIGSFQEYCSLLKADSSDELPNFVNAITTNLTSFFREPHHFRYLQEFLHKETSGASPKTRLRIWSAACSTGEEPYSLAMTAAHTLASVLDQIDLKILATDLDTNVLATAKAGIYSEEACNDIPSPFCNQWLAKGTGENAGLVRIKPEIKQLLQFNQLNLMDDWPMKGPFDVIMCRNVLIYFDRPTQRQILSRFFQLLRPGGTLLLGHSETVGKEFSGLEVKGRTIYQRKL